MESGYGIICFYNVLYMSSHGSIIVAFIVLFETFCIGIIWFHHGSSVLWPFHGHVSDGGFIGLTTTLGPISFQAKRCLILLGPGCHLRVQPYLLRYDWSPKGSIRDADPFEGGQVHGSGISSS